MKILLALVVALLSCAHIPFMGPPAPAKETPPKEASKEKEVVKEPPLEPIQLKIPVCVEMPAKPKYAVFQCKLPPAPEAPAVDWAPKGCEVRKFGACLSVKDMAAIIRFRQDIEVWAAEATRQCKAIKE